MNQLFSQSNIQRNKHPIGQSWFDQLHKAESTTIELVPQWIRKLRRLFFTSLFWLIVSAKVSRNYLLQFHPRFMPNLQLSLSILTKFSIKIKLEFKFLYLSSSFCQYHSFLISRKLLLERSSGFYFCSIKNICKIKFTQSTCPTKTSNNWIKNIPEKYW